MSWPKRINGQAKINAVKTHCKYGHKFTVENTILKNASTASGKMRACRKCKIRRDTNRRRSLGQKERNKNGMG